MKRQIIIAIIFLSFLVMSSVLAQTEGSENSNASAGIKSKATGGENQPSQVADINILVWAKKEQIDWFTGLLLALTGLIGSLVTIYGLIGTAMPGTAGQVNINAENVRLDQLRKKQDDLWKEDPINAHAAQAIEVAVNNLYNNLNKERWRQFSLAAFLYAILGAFFASLLAQDVIQALLIGAGWTGYLGAFGLKREMEERGSRKDQQIDVLVSGIKEKDKTIDVLQKSHQDVLNSLSRISNDMNRKFYVIRKGGIQVKDAGGESIYSLLEGTKEKGPFYNVKDYPDFYTKMWTDRMDIGFL